MKSLAKSVPSFSERAFSEAWSNRAPRSSSKSRAGGVCAPFSEWSSRFCSCSGDRNAASGLYRLGCLLLGGGLDERSGMGKGLNAGLGRVLTIESTRERIWEAEGLKYSEVLRQVSRRERKRNGTDEEGLFSMSPLKMFAFIR